MRKYCAQNKPKFFWLFLWDMINTRNLLQRKNMILPSYTCSMCVENVVEDIQLFSLVALVILAGLIWEFIGT
jgi:hypothetical protein